MSYFSDTEKRLLFSALSREKNFCKSDKYFADLLPVLDSLEEKFRYDRFEKEIRKDTIVEHENSQENTLKEFAEWASDFFDGYYLQMFHSAEDMIKAFYEHKQTQSNIKM